MPELALPLQGAFADLRSFMRPVGPKAPIVIDPPPAVEAEFEEELQQVLFTMAEPEPDANAPEPPPGLDATPADVTEPKKRKPRAARFTFAQRRKVAAKKAARKKAAANAKKAAANGKKAATKGAAPKETMPEMAPS